jgi:hypothetical protein
LHRSRFALLQLIDPVSDGCLGRHGPCASRTSGTGFVVILIRRPAADSLPELGFLPARQSLQRAACFPQRFLVQEVSGPGRHWGHLGRRGAFGRPAVDGAAAAALPGRGHPPPVPGQGPAGRSTLRRGTGNGPERMARTPARQTLPGQLRGPRTPPLGRETSPGGRRHSRPRRAAPASGSGTEVPAAVYESVRQRGARGLTRPRLRRSRRAQGTHGAGHPEPSGLAPPADSESQATHEDEGDRRAFCERPGRPAGGPSRPDPLGNRDGHESERQRRRLRSGGAKPGPPRRVKPPKVGTTSRPRNASGRRWECWWGRPER